MDKKKHVPMGIIEQYLDMEVIKVIKSDRTGLTVLCRKREEIET